LPSTATSSAARLGSVDARSHLDSRAVEPATWARGCVNSADEGAACKCQFARVAKNTPRRRYRRAWVSVSTVGHTSAFCHNCHGKSAVVFHVRLPIWSGPETNLYLYGPSRTNSLQQLCRDVRVEQPTEACSRSVLQMRSLFAPSRAVFWTSDIGSSAGALLRAASSILVCGGLNAGG
jgi:hypothetical protein